jgi:hypothetical protein
MRARLCTILIAAGFAVAGAPAAAAGLLSYGLATSDATVREDGRTFRFYVHPHENLLLIQPSMGQAITKHPDKWPQEVWRHAAETLVSPAGCAIVDVHDKSKIGATWEASYACPSGVDLRALMMAQRPTITRGEPLRPPTTASANASAAAIPAAAAAAPAS